MADKHWIGPAQRQTGETTSKASRLVLECQAIFTHGLKVLRAQSNITEQTVLSEDLLQSGSQSFVNQPSEMHV
eukprot:scaffold374610_cov18-Prasinocladus_malaysianus.AAC.1